MKTPRASFAHATVNDIVYALGGRQSTTTMTASTERYYDGSWEPSKVVMDKARYGHAAISAGGQFYVFGGCTDQAGLSFDKIFSYCKTVSDTVVRGALHVCNPDYPRGCTPVKCLQKLRVVLLFLFVQHYYRYYEC